MALISGKQIKSILAEKIITNAKKQFVSDEEKASWSAKTSVNDSVKNAAETWSSNKIDSELNKKVNASEHFSLNYNEDEDCVEIIFK